MGAECVSAFLRPLIGKPSVDDGEHCAICGRPARDRHHVIQKGMGGYGRRTLERIPLMRLCGFGNNDGCHGLIHQGRLHVYWDEGLGGWCFWVSPDPMKDFDAWYFHSGEYQPVPGWAMRKESEPHVFGCGRYEEEK